MNDQYYSKKLDKYFPTRLDILLYAHDGRGLGHVSRTIAIGLALKRLYPELRILLVTGEKISQSLIGNANLDWIKLPSYASQINNGVSTGVNGPANFYKSVLGQHRQTMLTQIVESFKPKCVLVDHSPVGKRKELIEAITQSKKFNTKWILGLRAVIGTQGDFWSDHLSNAFQNHYHSLLWYGDMQVLGSEHIDRINSHFHYKAKETGYVSRLFEVMKLQGRVTKKYTGIISIPWLSGDSLHFIMALKDALQHRDTKEKWKIFIDTKEVEKVKELFEDVTNCTIEPVGDKYVKTLLSARMAIIYGGYNSLMDVCAVQVPAIVILRCMKDQEQDLHIKKLVDFHTEKFTALSEVTAKATDINNAIESHLNQEPEEKGIDLNGSTNAAKYLHSILN